MTIGVLMYVIEIFLDHWVDHQINKSEKKGVLKIQ